MEKKNSLTSNKGLSLSQAQSISNLCNQRAREIESKLNGVNNYSKSVAVVQPQSTTPLYYITVAGKPLPTNVVDLLTEKAKLHACQAFLMENIKAKENLLNSNKKKVVDISSVEVPVRPATILSIGILPVVDEDFGWSQLTISEINECLEAEAFAAHIGQFIHKGGTLDNLRKELPEIPSIEWMTVKDGEKTPVTITVHHSPEQLIKIHEELAALHRQYEQRVNYFKAKVKNITTEENARIAKVNADIQNDVEKKNKESQTSFQTAYLAYSEKVRTIQSEFEKERQAKIKEIASMRIGIDARFQEVIDIFLKQLSDTQE